MFTFEVIGPHGPVTIRVADVNEAGALLRALSSPPERQPSRVDREEGPSDREIATRFARELAVAGPRGISSAELAKRLGYSGPQALRVLNDVITRVARQDLGLDALAPDIAARKKRNGHMRWFHGDRFAEFALRLGLADPRRGTLFANEEGGNDAAA